MTIGERLSHWLWRPFQLQERSDDSALLARIKELRSTTPRPWRMAGISEALGIPVVYAAVNLISNISGSLTLNGYRRGQRLADDARPRLIVRPNPLSTTREFFRETAYSMATRGEGWWWVAVRDPDGAPLSLWPVPPQEVIVTENPRDPRFPEIQWRGQRMPNEDMIQVVLQKEPGDLRGKGPLQMCGAAVSVGVEAQEWAANFFATGGNPSLNLHSKAELSEDEATALRDQWIATPPNMPQVTSGELELRTPEFNSQGAQMMTAREYQNGDFARMFNIPGSLLDHAIPGTSLTYQNVGNEFDKFVRLCLLPNYLEPMEQALSDLLTRSTTARFNTEALLRADAKTRWDIYETAVTVLGPEEAAAYARTREGLAAGDIENAPVPLAQPQAIPSSLPIAERSLSDLRCPKCGKLAGRVAGAAEIACTRCGQLVAA